MLSNLIANFALKRGRKWLDRHFKAITHQRAEFALDRAEFWDDVRMWIDGLGSWQTLRARRYAEREYHARLSRPFAETIVEGPGL